MDEELVEQHVPTVGERLKAAREEKGLALEDIAAQTRIPQRHLESIEVADWDKLPAPTYTTGFAKSYASAVGLDRTEIGEQLREEMGGQRFAASTPEVFEPADPARTMPKWLVFGTIAAVILLVVLMSWLNRRSLDQTDDATANASAPATATAPAQAPTPPPQAAPAAQGPVVLAATQPVWLKVTDGGATLFSGILQPGQNYAVPANASAPMLTTAKAEALRINVGSAVAPSVGPPATKISDVSLRAADLLKGPQAAPASGRAQRAPAASPPPPVPPAPATTNTGQ